MGALIKAQEMHKVKHIGVSNFNRRQIMELEQATGVLPVNNQIELSPFSPKEVFDFVDWMHGKGISVTAYGSLGHSGNRLRENKIGSIQQKYSKTTAQILLRWAIDKNIAVVP